MSRLPQGCESSPDVTQPTPPKATAPRRPPTRTEAPTWWWEAARDGHGQRPRARLHTRKQALTSPLMEELPTPGRATCPRNGDVRTVRRRAVRNR